MGADLTWIDGASVTGLNALRRGLKKGSESHSVPEADAVTRCGSEI